MTVTVNRSHSLAVYKDSNAVADVLRVERAHAFAIYRDTTAVIDVLRVERSHSFAIYYNENQVDSRLTVKRSHSFAIYKQTQPGFKITSVDHLAIDWPIPGSYSVNIRASDISGHFDKTLSITINEDITRATRFSNGFSNGFEH